MHEPKEQSSYDDSRTFSQAMEFSKSGNHKAAIPLFQRVIAERPNSGFVYLCLARCHQMMGQYNVAISLPT